MKDPHDIIEKFFRSNRDNERDVIPVYPNSNTYLQPNMLDGKDIPRNEVLVELFNLTCQQEISEAKEYFTGDTESLVHLFELLKDRWLEGIETFVYEDTLKHIDTSESGISENIMNVYEKNKSVV